MKSWIRIDLDEDQEILKCITLGPAIKEYIETLGFEDYKSFCMTFLDLLFDIWNRDVEGDEKN